MKAAKVRVDPDAPFGAGVLKILSVRLDEMYSLAASVDAPEHVQALHDMRIAAKRVRYVLEVAEPAFGDPARRGVKAMKRLQDLMGEIRDCDELLPIIRRHVRTLREEDVEAARAKQPLPNRRKYRGLEALRAHTVARRERLYAQFVRRWAKLESDDFRGRLERDLAAQAVPA